MARIALCASAAAQPSVALAAAQLPHAGPCSHPSRPSPSPTIASIAGLSFLYLITGNLERVIVVYAEALEKYRER